LYNVVYNNNPLINVILPIDNINNLPLLDAEYIFNDSHIFSLCIYPEIQQKRTIGHYFTLIVKNDKYYINSSYGSEYVCIPQYTTEINAYEFNKFCISISNLNDDTNKNNFIDFFQKFFLKGGFQKRLISSDASDWSSEDRQKMNLYLPVEVGKNSEINFYFNPIFNYSFKIGLIQNYKSDLINYIEGMFSKTVRMQTQRTGRKVHSYLKLNTSNKGGNKYKQTQKHITLRIKKRKQITRRIKKRNNRTKQYRTNKNK
jgi:hypothetical protein